MRIHTALLVALLATAGTLAAAALDAATPPLAHAPSFVAATAALLPSPSPSLHSYALTSDDTPSLGDPFPCQWTAPDGSYFDFSTMSVPGGVNIPGGNNDIYQINVCGTTAVQGTTACATSTVCFEFKYFPGEWYSIAEYSNTPAANPPTFSLIDGATTAGGVALNFNNGNYKGTPVQVAFQFMCQPGPTVINPNHDSQTHWTIVVSGSQSCSTGRAGGGGGKKGLSGGWVFVIIVLVCTSVYIIGGCVFKHQKMGTQGIESCPNIDFWREFPGLVKDGCSFSWLKTRQFIAHCQGKQGPTGGSEYDTMH